MTSVRSLLGSASAAAVASLLALSSPAYGQTGPVDGWDIEATDVEPDAEIVYGTLANGMKYAIQQNDTPEGAASFRLHFNFGSLYEAENERGLAHFIEHMVFNGSTNVPEGEMIALLERQGLAFGADTNAYTGFDETVYQLDAPNATQEAIDTSLFLLREAAGEATFAPEAVDREREIITSERRARDSVGLRSLIARIGFQVPDTLFDDRLPIGLNEVLRNAPAERLKALYHRYYRPEYTTLIAVGDFDPAAMEAQVTETFADWQGVGPAGAMPDFGSVDFARAAAFDVFTDPGSTSSVVIASTRAYEDPADTVANRRTSMLEDLATAMFNRRMQTIANQPDTSLIGGGMGTDEFEPAALITQISLSTAEGAWADGLAIGEQELRRAQEYGFTDSELREALANMESNFRTAAEQENARTTRGLANALVSVAAENDFLTSPQWRFGLFTAMKGSLTLDAANAAFRDLWSGSEPLVTVNAKALDGGVDAIAAAWNQSTQLAVTAPVDGGTVEFAYDSFGDGPGTVVSDTMIDDLGIRTVTFANNVRLNIKQTDYQPGRVVYRVGMSGGQFILGDNAAGNGLFMQIASAVAGTGEHSLEEIQRLTAGRQVAPGITAGEDEFIDIGATTPADLDLQLKLAAAYLTDPGFRPEAQTRFSSLIGAVYGQLLSDPGTVFAVNSPGVFTDDPRFQFPDQAALAATSQEDMRAPFLANAEDAAIEIAIVGDVDPDTVIETVAQSFGALPMRAAEAPAFTEMRDVVYKDLSGAGVTEFVHAGQAGQALVASLWRTGDDGDFREEMGMRLLKEVMDLYATTTLREETAATYSPLVSSSMSAEYEDTGTFQVAANVAPENVAQIQALIPTLAERLRTTPVDDDILLRARQPLLEGVRTARQDNGFWLSVAAQAQSMPDRLDRAREEEAILQSLTAQDLMMLAQKYLTPDRRADVRVVPGPDAAE